MTKPLLCVTVTGETMADLRRRRDEVTDADLIELRLDTVDRPNVAAALAGRRSAVIVTCRAAREGGSFRGSEAERRQLLADAISLGAEYVDIEWSSHWEDLIAQVNGRGIVVSLHDFNGTPPDLAARYRDMRATGAQVVKIAVQARRLSDCNALLELGQAAAPDGPLVLLAMGPHGLPTRVLAGRFNSAWTYAGGIEDIGQISAKAMLRDYQFRTLGDNTALYGIVGRSVSHSVSPAMHNAAFRALRLDAVYLPLPAESADDFVSFGRSFGISGASVTIPHKIAVCERLDEVDAVARRIGAVNTVRVADGRWLGGNTDASGFLRSLQERIPLGGVRASILGAGGAARAVAVALASSECTVTVHARSEAKAANVAMLTSASIGPWPPAPDSWDLLINCTPVGQFPHADATPVPMQHLTGRYVYDLVYNPMPTRLMREAAEMGCQTIGGLEMLVAQAQEQFSWWTGSRAPASVMRDAAAERLAEYSHDEDHVI